MRPRIQNLVFALLVVSFGCGTTTPADEGNKRAADPDCEVPGINLVRAYPKLQLRDVTAIHWEPNVQNGRVFAVEKLGRILTWPDRDDVTQADVQTFLDWRNGAAHDEKLTYQRGDRFGKDAQQGWEEGMLDMAFHPDWPRVPEVYVTYNTGLGDPEAGGEAQWNLARFTSTDGGKSLNKTQGHQVLLHLEKKGLTHNAGRVLFHPVDRTLFVSIGTDGGFPFDLHGHSQNRNDLFGKIIRIDVNPATRDQKTGYSIPKDNPFFVGASAGRNGGAGARPEIWTLGNRNPWKMNFDSQAPHDLWGAEIGENAQEEVNIYKAGQNYGYPFLEGIQCTFRGIDAGRCNQFGAVTGGLTAPEFVLYASGNSDRPKGGLTSDSITGGYVYRGTGIPNLEGTYVFADFLSGQIFGNRVGTKQPFIIAESGKPISAFGENPQRELVVVAHFHQEQSGATSNGEIFRIVAAPCKKKQGGAEANYVFLAADGAGTEETARTYYKSILPGKNIDTYTLADFKRDLFKNNPTVSQLYKNDWDLSFWRDMTCTQEIKAGDGACCVTNWTSEFRTPPDLGTVCMSVSPESEGGPYTRFYVFADPDPQGGKEDSKRKLQTFAILDDENKDGTVVGGKPDPKDKKFVPQLCTPCHGGVRYKTGGSPNIGSIFREFEPAVLTALPGSNPADFEQKFFELNQTALSANKALKVNTPMIEYIETHLYPTGGPPARDVFLEEPPPSWTQPDRRANGATKSALWKSTINAFCMGCHRVRKVEVNFADYEKFHGMGAVTANGAVPIRDFTTGDYTRRPNGHPPWMPHTQRMFDRLSDRNDARGKAARTSIEAWLLDMGTPEAAPTCTVQFVSLGGPNFTQPGEDAFVFGTVGRPDSGELGGFNVDKAVALDGTTFPTWKSAQIKLPAGVPIEFKVFVKTPNRGLLFEGPAFVNHQVTLPKEDNCGVDVEFEFDKPGSVRVVR